MLLGPLLGGPRVIAIPVAIPHALLLPLLLLLLRAQAGAGTLES